MSMTNRSAMAPARTVIEDINLRLAQGSAERNMLMAKEYFASLMNCGLIERGQFEELVVNAELTYSRWSQRKESDRFMSSD